MRCKEVRRLTNKWFRNNGVTPLCGTFKRLFEIAATHIVKCDKCRSYYNTLADEYNRLEGSESYGHITRDS